MKSKAEVVVTLEITVPMERLPAFYKDMKSMFGQKTMRKIMQAVSARQQFGTAYSYPITPVRLKRTWHTVPWARK